MKFEEAYCSHAKKTLTIQKVAAVYKFDTEEFVKHYKEGLYCPECKEAKLSYNNAAIPYFKTYPKAKHCENCSLRQEEMGAKEIKEYIDSKEGKERAERNIESLMIRLLDESTDYRIKGKNIKANEESERPNSSTPLTKSNSRKRFPQKRIDTMLSEEDLDIFKLFYGTVNICWECDNRSNDFKLILRNKTNRKFLCKIRVTTSVYSHINPSYKFEGYRECKIVFLASLKKSKNTVYTSLSWSGFLSICFD